MARRYDARRAGILRAAARIFRARGVAGAGMREIAEAADLSPANLYHYFRGKDELLYFCQDRALDRMLAAVRDARRATADPVTRLTRVLASHLRTVLDVVEGATAHVSLDGLPPALRRSLVGKRDRYERGVRRLLEEGVAAGVLSVDDPALVTRAMFGALNWTTTWFRPDGRTSVDEIADALPRYLVSGLVRETGRRAGVPGRPPIAPRR